MFSDILVIPEAMGQDYSFRPTGGIENESKNSSPKSALKIYAQVEFRTAYPMLKKRLKF